MKDSPTRSVCLFVCVRACLIAFVCRDVFYFSFFVFLFHL